MAERGRKKTQRQKRVAKLPRTALPDSNGALATSRAESGLEKGALFLPLHL